MTASGTSYVRIWRERAAGLLTGPRVGPLWITAALGLAFFAAFRGALLAASIPFVRGVGPITVARCLAVGLLYDAAIVGYALLPLVLLLWLPDDAALAGRRFRRAVTLYATTLLVAAVFVESVGTGFYLHFGLRLNWMVVDYLWHWQEVGTFLWNNYPAWLLVVGPVIGYWLTYRLLHWLFWRRPARATGRWPRLAVAVVLLGACVIACRGGLGHRPIGLGLAYFHENKAVNQLALNNFFSFFYASQTILAEIEGIPSDYRLPHPAEAGAAVTRMFFQKDDVRLESEDNPLLRRSPARVQERPYNVVLILMEGMSGEPVGAMGYDYPSQTPCFDQLCKEGAYFDHVYAVGGRTHNGVVSVLCGHPDLPGRSLLKRRWAQGGFLTLPAILRQRGYRTLFLYGGDPDFDNMRQFLTANGGIEKFVGQDELVGNWHEAGTWGVPDEVLLKRVHAELEALGDRPFFAFVLTTSNHEPFEAPPGKVQTLPPIDDANKRLNAYRYADWALGEFFRQARGSAYFERTIFVLVADHGRQLSRTRPLDVPGFRVPLLIYAPKLLPARHVDTVGSQADVPTTILSLVGPAFEHCFMGRDLLNVPEDDGFAFLAEDDRMGLVRNDLAVVMLPNRRPPVLYRIGVGTMTPLPADQFHALGGERLQLELLSYYRVSWDAYLNRAFRTADTPAPREP